MTIDAWDKEMKFTSLVLYQFVGMTDQSLDTQKSYTIQFQKYMIIPIQSNEASLGQGMGQGRIMSFWCTIFKGALSDYLCILASEKPRN